MGEGDETSGTPQEQTDQVILDAAVALRYQLAANLAPVEAPGPARPYVSGPDSLERVAESLTRGDWAQARWLSTRLTLDGVAGTAGSGGLLSHDPVLTDHCVRLGDMLMDEIARSAECASVSEVPELFLSALLMPRTGAYAAISHALLTEHLDERKEIVKLAAMSVTDSGLRIRATRELIANLKSPDDLNVIDGLMKLPDVDHAMGNALLELRPRDSAGSMIQQELLIRHLNRPGWYPDERKVLDAFASMVETARLSGDFGEFSNREPHELLRGHMEGTAIECIKRDMGRAAAIVSLCSLHHDQSDESIQRGIFESVRNSDWPLALRVLEVARWPSGPIEPDRADHFHLSITPALRHLVGHFDRRYLARLLELGDACLHAVDGTPGENTRRYTQVRDEIVNGRYEGIDSSVVDAVAMNYMVDAMWGVRDPEALTSSLQFGWDPEVLEQRGRHVLSGQSVKHYAVESSVVRRWGPAALLTWVDIVIESGDLLEARELLDWTSEVYPRHSMVMEWRHKLAKHTWNDEVAAAAIGQLRELWREDADEASPLTQVGVLERLAGESAAAEFVKERARRVALVPAFRRWVPRLRRITDG